MDNYVQYHNSEAMQFSCLKFGEGEVDNFGISTSKSVSNLIGNRVWLIGGIDKPRKYYLCYYFLVDTIEPLGRNSYFKFSVDGQQGHLFKPAILLNDFSWFKDFLKSQQNFSMGLRKIGKPFVDELEKFISGQEVQNLSLAEQAQNVGGGFGSSETNRKVEQAAISCVTTHYKERGWLIESVESEKRGFDLLCTKSNIQEHVEVKGIQGGLISFIITAGEVRQSRSDENFVLCVVTSALSTPKLHKFTAKEFNEQFALEVIAYRAFSKQK